MIKSRSLFQIIRAHKLLATVTLVITVVLMNVFTMVLVKPYYSSEIDLIATQSKNGDTATKNIQTYQDLIKTPLVLAPVHRELVQKYGYQGSMTDLKNSIDTTTEEGSRVFTVTAKGERPLVVRYIANRSATLLETEASELVNPSNVRPLKIGKTAVHRHQLNPWIVVTLSVLTGMLLAVLLSIWRDISNAKVSRQYLDEADHLHVIETLKLDDTITL